MIATSIDPLEDNRQLDVTACTIACATEIGPRLTLEDLALNLSLDAGPRGACAVLALFDGAGGCNAGDVASGTAEAVIGSALGRAMVDFCFDPEPLDEALERALLRAFDKANAMIVGRGQLDPECSGMATTAVVAAHVGNRILVCWAGDSRAHVIRDGAIVFRTIDHTLGGELLERGLISDDQARWCSEYRALCRYLGDATGVDPQVAWFDLRPGDAVLLTSDGVTDVMNDDQLIDLTSADLPLDDVASLIVRKAIEAGSTDNATALFWRDSSTSSQVTR